MNLLILSIYILGYIAAWRSAFAFFITDMTWGRPDAGDVVFSCAMSTLVSIMWPLWLIPMTMYHFIKPSLNQWIDSKWGKE
jgi:hypothetical protein